MNQTPRHSNSGSRGWLMNHLVTRDRSDGLGHGARDSLKRGVLNRPRERFDDLSSKLVSHSSSVRRGSCRPEVIEFGPAKRVSRAAQDSCWGRDLAPRASILHQEIPLGHSSANLPPAVPVVWLCGCRREVSANGGAFAVTAVLTGRGRHRPVRGAVAQSERQLDSMGDPQPPFLAKQSKSCGSRASARTRRRGQEAPGRLCHVTEFGPCFAQS
jgi:hypothetical protein